MESESATTSSSKYDSSHADLERVTDYYDECESKTSATAVVPKETAAPPPFDVVKLREADILTVAKEMDIGKGHAERALRHYNGDVKRALVGLITRDFDSVVRV